MKRTTDSVGEERRERMKYCSAHQSGDCPDDCAVGGHRSSHPAQSQEERRSDANGRHPGQYSEGGPAPVPLGGELGLAGSTPAASTLPGTGDGRVSSDAPPCEHERGPLPVYMIADPGPFQGRCVDCFGTRSDGRPKGHTLRLTTEPRANEAPVVRCTWCGQPAGPPHADTPCGQTQAVASRTDAILVDGVIYSAADVRCFLSVAREADTLRTQEAPHMIDERVFLAEVRQVERFRTALTKLNEIRNSIVGVQGFNFSEHAYPMVAALNEAGFEGLPYPEARENVGTLLERATKAETELEALRDENERLRDDRNIVCGHERLMRQAKDVVHAWQDDPSSTETENAIRELGLRADSAMDAAQRTDNVPPVETSYAPGRAKIEHPRAGRVRIIVFGEPMAKDEQIEVDESWLRRALDLDYPQATDPEDPCIGLHADQHPSRGWALVVNGRGYPMSKQTAEDLERILRKREPEPRTDSSPTGEKP